METWIGHVFPTIFQIMKCQSVGGKLVLLIRKVIAMSNMEMLKAHFDTFPIYLPHSSTSRNKLKNITRLKTDTLIGWTRLILINHANFEIFPKICFFGTSKFSKHHIFDKSYFRGIVIFEGIVIFGGISGGLFWTWNSGIGICLFSVPVMFFHGSFSHVSGS